jgi:hypothetical protein
MTQIADATAFYQPGVSEIVLIPSIADPGLVATDEEIAGGLRLLNEVYDVDGFSQSTAWIERRRAGSRTRTQIAGASSFAGSSITFTMDKAGNDAAAEFEESQTGYLYFADRGLVAALPAEVFQVEVGAVVTLRNYDSDYPRIRVDFGINRREKVVIPTLTLTDAA